MHNAITIIKSSRQANFTTYLNSIFTDIQFMMEVEKNGVLPFLDVLAHRRDNGELTTSVFRKTTNTLQILSYNSNHPQTDERSCVKTLFKRVDTHCITLEAKKKKFVTSSDNFPLMATQAQSYKRLYGSDQQALPLKDRAYGKQFPISPTSQKQSPVSSSRTESELPNVKQENCEAD